MMTIKKIQNNAGFTLMEMMFVLVVIAIMGAIAIPNFQTYNETMYIKSAARDLYSTMQEARMIAIRDNIMTAIIFDTTNERYYLCDDRGADNAWNGVGDLTGTGDNNIIATGRLSNYKNGVKYGQGAITGNNSVTGTAFPADWVSYVNNFCTMNAKGVGTGGYVYIENTEGSHCFAVGTSTSGRVRLLKYMGGGTWQ